MAGIMFMPAIAVIPAEPMLPKKPNVDQFLDVVIVYCCTCAYKRSAELFRRIASEKRIYKKCGDLNKCY
jgi:hypothetical protein